VLAFALLIPYYGAVRASNYLELSEPENVRIVVQWINDLIDASPGEVLFSDQRQLLTFGYVPAIPFIAEYEKKYMMDQAMAGNAAYFKDYYRDLAEKRFSLIITEYLTQAIENPARDDFAEENNAWQRWVAEPTLCFYEPVARLPQFNIDLLVPRAETVGCAHKLLVLNR
jgi:hypothetical protein